MSGNTEAMEALATLDRESKVMLYVVHTMDELKTEGLVRGGPFEVSESGKEVAKALIDSGFRPTKSEIVLCLQCLQSQAKG